MKTKTIRQTVSFKAPPHEVYEAFMDSEKHRRFTGGAARISRKVGGKFTVFDGWATGSNQELIPDKLIVQSWRAAEWPEGHFSQLTLDLEATAAGTRLRLTQTGVPEEDAAAIRQGWTDYYWGPLKELLGEAPTA
jgi:activator of HSP90 ATPase